jgi:hypothetical protein
MTRQPRRRKPALSRLMFGTMPRAPGTSAGPPGAQKVLCISTVTSAVFRRFEPVEPAQPAAARHDPVDDLLPDGDAMHDGILP